MPDTKPKPFVFVLMPFDGAFEDVYKLGIKATCEEAGAYCERVDEQIFQDSILSRIYNQIAKADMIVADMTGRNPNVFYEVGYAHALGKQVILLTKNADDIPFDLKHYPHIIYGGKITLLKDELGKRVRWFVEHPTGRVEAVERNIELYIGETPLRNCPAFNLLDLIGCFELVIHNPTSKTMALGSFFIGIELPSELYISGYKKRIDLPNKRQLFFLAPFAKLFPAAWDKRELSLNLCPGEHLIQNLKKVENITFRVFSDLGTTDYPLKLKTRLRSTE